MYLVLNRDFTAISKRDLVLTDELKIKDEKNLGIFKEVNAYIYESLRLREYIKKIQDNETTEQFLSELNKEVKETFENKDIHIDYIITEYGIGSHIENQLKFFTFYISVNNKMDFLIKVQYIDGTCKFDPPTIASGEIPKEAKRLL